jgi:hypothetical protein
VPTKLTNDILAAAIEGFELQKKRIDDKIAEIHSMLGVGPTEPSVTPEVPVAKRKKFSAAARRKMALAQKTRWAKIKGDSEPPTPAIPEAPKPKRQISADGLKRIAAAQRQRWAVKKAAEAQASAKKAVVKKTAVKKMVKKTTAKKTAAVAQAAD